jgi:hypothetical protein
MSTLREAAQQALEALKNLSNCHDGPHDSSGECPSCHERSYMPHAPDCEKQNAITALRAALAQQTQTPCDIAEDGVCEVIDCCRNSTREEQEPTVRFKCTVVDDQHPNGVPFEQWVNAPQQEPVAQMRENALARWAHEQEEPPDTGWQRDWQRGYETARRWVRQVGLPSLAQQEAPKGGGNLPPPLQAEPVLVVEKEPDYMSRGHFYEGSKPFIDPTLVWKLPIGTKLYTAPPRREWQGLTEEEMDCWTPEIHPVIRAVEAKLKEKNA